MALSQKNENITLVCPKCLKGKFQGAFVCPECGARFSSEYSVTDLRIVKVDVEKGWNASVFDEIYSRCHFPDSRDDFRMLGIPEFVEKHRLDQRDGPILKFFAKYAPTSQSSLETSAVAAPVPGAFTAGTAVATTNATAKNIALQFSPEKILDSGCGDGCFTEKVARMLPESFFYGVDISPFRIGRFLNKTGSGNGKMAAVAANSEHLPFENSVFDAVLMREVLEHFYDPRKGLEEASRVLKPGGHIIVTTPSKMMFLFWRAVAFVPSFLRRVITGRKIFDNASRIAYDEPVSVSDLRDYFKTAGFEVVSWEKVIFLPHESYLQFFPEFMLRLMIFSAEIIKKLPFLYFTGLHHIIILRKK